MRLVLACAFGMTTSMLVNYMVEEVQNRGLDVEISAIPERTIKDELGNFDVLLLGPQVRYMLPQVKQLCGGSVPVDVVNMHDYAIMDGVKVLDQAIRMYEEFYGRPVQ
ncbi:MAG: PTS sugar transporter subunit IIB [bacterium]